MTKSIRRQALLSLPVLPVLVAVLAASGSVAHAQAPATDQPAQAGTGTSNGTGDVTNEGMVPAMPMTTTTETTDSVTTTDATVPPGEGDSTLPNTGGEPLWLAAGGLALAAGALALRRRLA
jgi:LPXTG-motif cell wall-anchored protein